MVSVFLGGKFGIGLILDLVAEYRLLALELAGFIAWFHPVEDGVLLILYIPISHGIAGRKRKGRHIPLRRHCSFGKTV
jgi:hypothetical protein